MSELYQRLREILGALGASDPAFKRFGAPQHHYDLAPPLTASEQSQIEERIGGTLPDEYLDYVTRFSAGGVGPYYGLLRADRAAAYLVDAPASIKGWKRALPIAHLGCGYFALLPIDGPASGQIWIDARAVDLVAPIRPGFTAFLLDWIDRLANSQWLEGFVPPGRCAITAALSGYLAMTEERLGVEAGTLDGQALRDAFAQLGPGAIEVTTDDTNKLFAPGDRVDPCVTCARALQGLSEQHGLRHDVVAPGLPPLPAR